jgi:DNA-binding PadR family transcriptional regulator
LHTSSTVRLTIPDLVVLALLYEKPMHGYELNQELLRREVSDWARVSRAQVYYSLRKLHGVRLVTAAEDQDPSAGPERTVFRLEQRGMVSFAEALDSAEWATQRPPHPFLTWLALSVHLPISSVLKGLRIRRAYVRKQLDREIATLAAFGTSDDPMAAIGRSLVSLGIAHFQTELEWLDETDRSLSPARPRPARRTRRSPR